MAVVLYVCRGRPACMLVCSHLWPPDRDWRRVLCTCFSAKQLHISPYPVASHVAFSVVTFAPSCCYRSSNPMHNGCAVSALVSQFPAVPCSACPRCPVTPGGRLPNAAVNCSRTMPEGLRNTPGTLQECPRTLPGQTPHSDSFRDVHGRLQERSTRTTLFFSRCRRSRTDTHAIALTLKSRKCCLCTARPLGVTTCAAWIQKVAL